MHAERKLQYLLAVFLCQEETVCVPRAETLCLQEHCHSGFANSAAVYSAGIVLIHASRQSIA